ncbi:MaoC family dehydratase [Euzebya tangerina]|uniref:MaoC family dehydratase n=1 Tax=Euzebya tangerina TaxID=591198 RepID=UPI000E322542|nr:MaoC family dehydratase [Euzebya tangerina]
MADVADWQGRYFEDFAVGDVHQHQRGRTISEVDNTWFTLLTMNTNQMHFNRHYAERSTFGKLLVNSGFTIALVLGMTVQDLSENAIANLAMTDIALTHPVFVGDTLYAESKITDLRESNSRPYAGIVSAMTRGLNQDGDVVMTYNRTVMVYKRSAPQDKDLFPRAEEPWPDA